MPKSKTQKSVAKRFTITGKKKFVERYAGQDHFNARDKGKHTVRKRRDRVAAKVNRKALTRMIPYFQQ